MQVFFLWTIRFSTSPQLLIQVFFLLLSYVNLLLRELQKKKITVFLLTSHLLDLKEKKFFRLSKQYTSIHLRLLTASNWFERRKLKITFRVIYFISFFFCLLYFKMNLFVATETKQINISPSTTYTLYDDKEKTIQNLH